MPDVTFSFDPACPWTWRTSRWLLDVAPKRDLSVEWRAFSLMLANGGSPPEEHRTRLETSSRALRLIEALRGQGRQDDIERFYAEIGERVHERDREFDDDLLLEAVHAADLDAMRDALDDVALDAFVRASHEAAFASAGPDVGSPIIEVDGSGRGLHGPIVDDGMSSDDAVAVWDAVERLIAIPQFFELKHGRG